MKKLTAVVIRTALMFMMIFTLSAYASLANPFNFDECSCTAPDGSCSVSITCSGQCIKSCKNNDNCYAACAGSHGFLEDEITLEMQDTNYSQLVAELSRVSGKEISFTPTKPDLPFVIGFKRATIWDALKLLSEQGKVYVAGQDFEKLKKMRRFLLSGEKIPFSVRNAPVGTLVRHLSGLSGLKLRVTAGNPWAVVNIDMQEATLNDILSEAAEQTGTKIVTEGDSTDGR